MTESEVLLDWTQMNFSDVVVNHDVGYACFVSHQKTGAYPIRTYLHRGCITVIGTVPIRIPEAVRDEVSLLLGLMNCELCRVKFRIKPLDEPIQLMGKFSPDDGKVYPFILNMMFNDVFETLDTSMPSIMKVAFGGGHAMGSLPPPPKIDF